MKQSLTHVALVVRDYDEAIAFFTKTLDFTLVEDRLVPEQQKRWVVVQPPGSTGAAIVLARPSNVEQQNFIGNQTGGRVTFFLSTDDFWRDYYNMVERGVEFVRTPSVASFGTVAVFKDLYGNLWDLVERPRSAPDATDDILARVDHLLYATPDLVRGVAEIERLIGVRASPGGQHPGRGTHNALLSLGPTAYLEIIAPDPAQSGPVRPEVFAIDKLQRPMLITWSANGSNLEDLYQFATRNDIPLGPVTAGSRQRPDGVLLRWQFTEPNVAGTDGLIPFFIDWGSSPHPARSAAQGATLVGLRAEHPTPNAFREQLELLGLKLHVDSGPRPALIATIEGPRGRVELR